MHVDARLSLGTVERDVRRRVVAYEDSLLQIQGPNSIENLRLQNAMHATYRENQTGPSSEERQGRDAPEVAHAWG